VAAAHAGWRGLAGGVLERTVEALCLAARCEPGQLQAWLGPCIGPRQFEVGADVPAGFSLSLPHPRFVAHGKAGDKWLADLAGLAADRLGALGLGALQRDGSCTVEDNSRFFSHRRDGPVFGTSGRLAAAIWIDRRSKR
jgi:copper oxidase (laccase) domain-containing protein